MKRLFFGLALLTLGLIAAFVWLQRLGTSMLQVSTEPDAEIFLIDPSRPLAPIALGKGNASRRLKTGNYTLEARLGDQKTRRAIMVEEGDQSAHLPLKALKNLDLVASYSSRDISSNGSALSFLNVNAKQIYVLQNGQKTASRYQPVVYPVTRVHWISPDEALIEQPGKKYLWLSRGVVKDLPLSGVSTGDNHSNLQDLSVNRRGQIAYIASGQLYFKSGPAANSSLVTKLNDTAKVSLSPDGDIGVYFTAEERSHNDTPILDPFVVSPQDGRIRKLPLSTSPIESITWSPDGKQLLYLYGSITKIYSLATGQSHLVLGTRPSNTLGFTWISNIELAYIDDASIWLYNSDSKLSHKLVGAPAEINQPQPLAVIGTSLYFGTDPPGGFGSVGKIYRFRL
jgi:hypothetical protein